MCKKLNQRAKDYAKNQSDYYKRITCAPLTEFETQLIESTYKRAWLDAIRQAELIAIYSERDIIQRIKELKQ